MPSGDRLVGYIDATLGEHILDVSVDQSEAKIEPEGLLDDDARKAVASPDACSLVLAIWAKIISASDGADRSSACQPRAGAASIRSFK